MTPERAQHLVANRDEVTVLSAAGDGSALHIGDAIGYVDGPVLIVEDDHGVQRAFPINLPMLVHEWVPVQ